MSAALGFYDDDDMFEPRDMGEITRKLVEENRLRQQYDYLFAPERNQLERRISDLEERNTELRMKVHDAGVKITRLEFDLAKKARRKASGSGVKKGQRNRVVFHVRATMRDQESACLLGQHLADTRGPDSGKSMLVTAWGVDGNTLGFVVDYTVVGGHPADIWRDDPAPTRQGMLNRVVDQLGVEVIEVDCKQHLRERVEDAEMPSDGS